METVLKKLKFKENGVIINAPEILKNVFVKLGFSIAFDKKERSLSTLVFINNNKELIGFLDKQLKNVEPDSIFWFAYPKGTSKIKTDINRDIIRETVEAYGIRTVAAISIDETWSALRFRPIDKVGK